jgi:protein-S-isoprenylcysteine O-methyltransferase Ste14
MSNPNDAKKRTHRFGRWLLDHDDKIFGVVLSLIAIDNWRMMYLRLGEYWIYLKNGIYATPLLSLLSIAFSTLYVSIVAVILLTAPKPVARYETLLPNFLAVLAGFGVYSFGLLTPAETRPFGIYVPLALLVSGSGIVLFALFYLRRAFSVTPQARTVVRSGPYAFVRHPMYIGNILSITGLGLMIGTPQALLLALAACLLQVCRARYEDRLLARTFVDYGAHMSNVNGFIPRIGFYRGGRISLLCLAIVVPFLAHQVTAQTAAGKRIDPGIGAKCQAWHQKALSGQWFTLKEGEEFEATNQQQEVLQSIQGCKEFFQLQRRCEGLWYAPAVADAESQKPAVIKSKQTELLRAIEQVVGCKSIIGFENVCETVREEAKRSRLSPKLQSVLQECAEGSIANRTSNMLRPAL